MVRRIAEEIEGYIVELGVDGRLILLQLEELMGGVEDDRRAVIHDYMRAASPARTDEAMGRLGDLSTERLLDLKEIAGLLNLTDEDGELDASGQPRGYRLLSKIPRLPDNIIANIVERFGSLHKIMRATIDDLDEVEGVGDSRARAIKEGLSRLAETQHPRPLQLIPHPHDPDSRPRPLEEHTVRIDLPSGTPAELALPDGTPAAGLVLAPDIMGLRPLFDDLCARLAAEHGWAVCAPEPFPGREVARRSTSAAPRSPSQRDDDRIGDLVAAADDLGSQGCERVAVMGFCMGGMYALKASAPVASTGRWRSTG